MARGDCEPIEQQDIEALRNELKRTNLLLQQILDTLLAILRK